MQNSDFWTRKESLYWSQIWPVVLCMYNCVLSIRITSLYGSQPSSVAFACKTATSEPEKKVSIGPRYDLSFSACTTAYLASELLVSMGASLHLWFLHKKQQLLDHNYKSLCELDLTCRFVHANSVISTRNTSLYRFQPHMWFCAFKRATFRPNCLCLWVPDLTCDLLHANSVTSIRITSLYGSPPLSVLLCM